MRKLLSHSSGIRASALRVASLFALTLASGCAQSLGDIDRTQPDLIDKSHFDGEWFLRQTVIDVPPTSAAAFIGEMGGLEAVVWDVREDYLVGYRAYELVPGTDEYANTDLANPNTQPVASDREQPGRDNKLYRGNPIVAYRITSHVDVQRGYNARTGEQNNIISENTTDRPWYERKFMRVDWATNSVDSFITEPFTFWPIFGARESFSQYVPTNEGGEDAFHMQVDPDTKKANYIDFTVMRTVSPSIFGCFAAMNGDGIGDCTGDEIKVRTSMLKADPEREQEYVPMVYDDRRMGEFGYFRTERPTYDRKLGTTFTGLIQLANRHDIWEKSRNSDGDALPYNMRTLRSVTYTLSANYPPDLAETTQEMADEYDVAMKEAAAAARGQTMAELEADVYDDTGASCLFCLDLNAEHEARNGDLRRNFVYWVDDPQMIGPLGYGPSSAHPETGRIISAAAYMYGAGVDRQTEMAKEMVDLLNGDLVDADLVSGDFIRSAVRGGLKPIDPRALDAFRGLSGEALDRKILGDHAFENLEAMKLMGVDAFQPATPGWEESQLRKLVGTRLESMVTPEEWTREVADGSPHAMLMKAKARAEALANGMPPEQANPLSITNWGTAGALKEMNELANLASKNNLWLRSFSDPTLVGLAREMANHDPPLKGDELYRELRKRVFKSVALHELGHTVGLRHNFAGSADPLNYHPEYWDERAKTITPYQDLLSAGGEPPLSAWMASKCAVIGDPTVDNNAEACADQQNNKMAEYQYSSIMDYGGRVNSDFQGLGLYDRAAIASAYGDLVEVFDQKVMDDIRQASATLSAELGTTVDVRSALLDANQVRNPVLQQGLDVAVIYQSNGVGGRIGNYENYPQLLGGVANINLRHFVPRETYNPTPEGVSPDAQARIPVKVPYMACYDEFVDSVEGCHRWDFGADAYEIVASNLERYREYYVFNNFQRDRIGFDSFEVLNRTVSRYFMPMVNMYQHWYWGAAVTGINDRRFPRGLLGEIASTESFQTLWNVLATPRFGAHQLDARTGIYASNGNERCPEVVDDMLVSDPSGTPGAAPLMMPECVEITRGVGRSLFSRYDTSGYDIYRRVLESGHFYEQIGALIALSSSNASVVGFGSDVSADFRSFLIPFNLAFEDDVTQLFSSIFAADSRGYGLQMGRDAQGKSFVNVRSVFGRAMPAQSPFINPGRTFTTQIQALWRGMAFLSAGFDTSFIQRGQISLLGSGEQRDVPPDGYTLIEAADPASGRVYVAYRGPTDNREGPWYAADQLDEVNDMIDAGATPAQIRNAFENIEITRAMYDIFKNPLL